MEFACWKMDTLENACSPRKAESPMLSTTTTLKSKWNQVEIDVPQYILCPQCTQIPVTRTNELCEACDRQRKEKEQEAQKRYDLLYGHLLNNAQPPKRGTRNWRRK
jgi:hypothetical protein